MNQRLIAKLIRKDLHQYRVFMVLGVLCGLIALPLFRVGPGNGHTGINIGFLLYVSAVVALGMFIVMFGVLKEWQEKAALFFLSLPISPGQYFASKMIAAMLAFVLPWLLLGGAAVGLTLTSSAPDGGIPGLVAMMCFFLAHFSTVLALVLLTRTEAWAIGITVLTNIAMPLVITLLFSLPGMSEHARSNTVIWSPNVLWVVVLSLLVSVLAPGVAMRLLLRKKTLY